MAATSGCPPRARADETRTGAITEAVAVPAGTGAIKVAHCRVAGVIGKEIKPGDAAGSELYQRVAGLGEHARMPMGGKLDPEQIDLIKRWIDAGAVWPDSADVAAHGAQDPLLLPRRARHALRERATRRRPRSRMPGGELRPLVAGVLWGAGAGGALEHFPNKWNQEML